MDFTRPDASGPAAAPHTAHDSPFLGTGWGFPVSFDPRTRAAVMVSQHEDVAQSLHILLATVPGERVMHPSFGCGLHRLVFESLTESTLTEMRSVIEKAVLFFEPRVTLEQVHFELGDTLDGVLHIALDYTVRSTNTRHNMVYPLYLDQAQVAP
jgi:uncharacterized protein